MSLEDFDFGAINDQLIILFEAANEDINSTFSRLITQGDPTDIARVALIQRQINGILNILSEDSDIWIEDNFPHIFETAMADTFEDLRVMGFEPKSPFGAQFARLNNATLQAVAANTRADLQNAIDSTRLSVLRRFRQTQQLLLRDEAITEAIGVSVIKGESTAKQAARIMKAFGDDVAKVVIKGRNFNLANYSRLVAVSRTREASTQGVIMTMLHNGRDLVKVSSHPHKKDICTPFDGKVFSISGESEQFPALSSIPNGGPPFHPNCRHVLLPFIQALASEREIKKSSGVDSKFLDVEKTSELDRLVKSDVSLKEITKGRQPSI